MRRIVVNALALLLLFVLSHTAACSGQHHPVSAGQQINTPMTADSSRPVGEYVVDIFEDRDGRLWFSTLPDGVACYDGNTLRYLTTDDGLAGNRVTDMVQDRDGNMWVATQSGLSMYNGVAFRNFSAEDGLTNPTISNLLIDRNGQLWVGTRAGVFQWKNNRFEAFPLPLPDVQVPDYQEPSTRITEIMEDASGNIWFGRESYGACCYDGRQFRHFTQKDGLPSNSVQVIRQDRQGNIWLGTRVIENDHPDPEKRKGPGGLCRFDGKQIQTFPNQTGLHNNDIYSLFCDRAGNIWTGATRYGLYRFDGQQFTLYQGTDRMDLTYTFGLQSILEDRQGALWLGFSGGLFRLLDGRIVHVGRKGLGG